MEKLFWGIIVVWVILRITLMTLSINGNQQPEAREKVLKYFTEDDVKTGRIYALRGFYSRMLLPFFTVALLLVMMKFGIIEQFSSKISEIAGKDSFWLSNTLFIIGFSIFLHLISLPFDYYLGHISETEFGFSNQTSVGWFIRYMKSFAVSLIIETVSLMMVLWFFKTFQRHWPIIVPIGTTCFGIFMSILAPYIITPIFYTQKPLSEGTLKEKILKIADKSGISVEGIYEVDESKYSKHTNAYFSGLFSQKRIVLYDNLIKNHTEDETSLIFAHEAGHWLHDHVFKGISFGFLGSIAACIFLWYAFPFLQNEKLFCLKELHSAQNIPFTYIIFTVFSLFFAPIEAQISQNFERQADLKSLELTGLKKAFIDAEIRLAKDNKSELLPHPFRVFWLYSHPAAIDRIEMGEKFIITQKQK
ncbi:MAG: M48 family metallopeptidase [Candidatus Riflebacteria bacterium]|nr:M48 family metallopeptidase [Candidatus Riflebacteria bacterium]